MKFLKKLKHPYIWRRIFYERLSEPLHLNLLSAFIAGFGSYRQKIAFDLVVRQQHAYGLLKAADKAKSMGVKTVSVLEFGVATGAGLMNMERIARRITKESGISFKLYGFDSGQGMPPARDYRDHPDLYQQGDFPMNIDALKSSLDKNTQLIIGDISDTVGEFLQNFSSNDAPIGFVSIDVDYYHSAKQVLKVFEGKPEQYLPITTVYLDDINFDVHNSYCGELLAVREFNEEQEYRKIEFHPFLENSRIFRKANWIKHIYQLHVLDHPTRYQVRKSNQKSVLGNPYL